MLSSLAARLQAAPYTAASMGVLLIAAYLCLVNLDYVALWHDEAPAAFFGKALLQQGDYVGWDGRNLVGGTNGRTLNEQLRDVLPPLMYVLNAVGFAIFGVNEIGARIVHAVIGIVALGVFYLLLCQHLPKHPRLMFFIFAFAAGSAQLLLYFRQSRYFSVMVLSLILLFYLYERYWRSRNLAYLPVIALVAANRLRVNWTLGDLPFYEELDMGGSDTVRGVARARDRGEARIVFNGELRWCWLPIWHRQHLYMGLVAFGDLGQIFARDALPTSDGWRGGSGMGLRCHWQSTIVRADYGTSGGRRALYITFSQVF